jgi:NADH dehydrogenase FAD-containing subunit
VIWKDPSHLTSNSWAGFNLSRQLDKKKFQTIVVSPRSYFAFTPLLASTAVGTLEFRTAIESVRGRTTDVEFFQGWADDVDFNKKRITVEETAIDSQSQALLKSSLSDPNDVPKKGKNFTLDYDKLVVAVGCYSQTFNTPGVRESALFLKDVGDARKIRKRILDCIFPLSITRPSLIISAGFEKASLPSTPEFLRRSLLNFAVVGGGRKLLSVNAALKS